MTKIAEVLTSNELIDTEFHGIAISSHAQWCNPDTVLKIPCPLLTDGSILRVLEVKGSDRMSWLQGQLTQDLRSIPTNKGLLGASSTSKGRINALVEIHPREDRILLVSWAQDEEALRQNLDMYLITEDVQLEVAAEQPAVLFLGESGTELALKALKLAAFEPESSGFLLLASDWIQKGSLILIPKTEATLNLEEEDFHILGASEIDTHRIQHGFPLSQSDYADQKELVPELGLPELISYSKGCYLGQEVFARIKTYGRTNKVLAPLSFPGATAKALLGQEISVDGKSRGAVTSAVDTPKGALALGYIPTAKAEPGTGLVCSGLEGVILEKN